MNNIREQFEKKTGMNPINPGIDIYRVHYIKYLEQQIEAKDKVIEAVRKWKNDKQVFVSIIDVHLIKVYDEYEARQ